MNKVSSHKWVKEEITKTKDKLYICFKRSLCLQCLEEYKKAKLTGGKPLERLLRISMVEEMVVRNVWF